MVPSHFYRQSAALPYRQGDDGLEVLLITSLRKKTWIFPKGVVEPDMTPWESAEKEAWEEAGVGGRITQEPLGEYETEKWGGVCRIEVFPMCVEHEARVWPEMRVRKRRWAKVKEARRLVSKKELKDLLASLPKSL